MTKILNAEQPASSKSRQPKQSTLAFIGLATVGCVFVISSFILYRLNNPDESVVQIAVGKEILAKSKEDKAKVWLWATEHFDPSNAHDSASLAENIALSECKPEYMKAVETYLQNEGASLPTGRRKFLLDFASSVPDHIGK